MWYCIYLFIAAFALIAPTKLPADNTLVNMEKVAADAYIYGYPAVLMDVSKDVMTNTPNVTDIKAPIDQFYYMRKFPTPAFKDVVSPNADTLYSVAWLDLSKEPIILSIPDMGNRYYLFPMLDIWTNVFFSPGTRTTGQGPHNFAITGPYWQGNLPAGVEEHKSPSNLVWILGRIQTNGPPDYAAVNKLQDQFKLVPLSAWGKDYVPPRNVQVSENVSNDPPVQQVFKMDGITFFKRLAHILKETPIPAEDTEFVKQFAAIGLVPGEEYDESRLTAEQKQVINQSVLKAQKIIVDDFIKQPLSKVVNGWNIITSGVGNYGTQYALRAYVAYGGLGANLPADAIYPFTRTDYKGEALNGEHIYLIHFNKDQLPPVKGFWSITMYNNQQFFVENPINRYAIGNRDNLKFNEDGSLDIYIQNKNPGGDKERNWLPAPQGPFNLIMRLYAPDESVLKGTWIPPGVMKVQ